MWQVRGVILVTVSSLSVFYRELCMDLIGIKIYNSNYSQKTCIHIYLCSSYADLDACSLIESRHHVTASVTMLRISIV
jgi:hypothetical protein